MNKYQEALDRMYDNYVYGAKQKEDSYFTLQELVDKATPIKPTLYKPIEAFNDYDIEQPFHIIKCGKCEYWLEPSDKFCPYCGTEIDWSTNERPTK